MTGTSICGPLAPAGRRADDRVQDVTNHGHTTVSFSPGSRRARAAAGRIGPGWVSPTYGVKLPAPVVVVHADGVHADIVTVLTAGEAADFGRRPSIAVIAMSDTAGRHDGPIQWSSTDDVVWNRWAREDGDIHHTDAFAPDPVPARRAARRRTRCRAARAHLRPGRMGSSRAPATGEVPHRRELARGVRRRRSTVDSF